MDRTLIIVGAASGLAVFLVGQVVWALVKPIPYQEDLLALPPRGAVAVARPADPVDPDPGGEDTVPLADPGAVAAGEDDEAITFISFEGSVERKAGKAPWTAVQGKERVEVGDFVRTGAESRADLQFGANCVLKLRAGSQLAVRKQEIPASTFVLQKGQAEITSLTREKTVVVIGPKAMEVRADNARLEAFVEGAVFGAVNNAGRVELRSGKAALDVPEGMAGWAVGGKAPLPPRVYTGDPELEVEAIEGGEVRVPALVVKGSAHPLAHVAVNDKPVKLRPDGSFAARVALDEGDNRVWVTASLLSGELKSTDLPTVTRVATAGGDDETPAPVVKPKPAAKPKAAKKPAPKKGATMKWGAGP